LKGEGLDTFWASVKRFRELQSCGERLTQRRRQQSRAWMWERIDAGLKQRFREHPRVHAQLDATTALVVAGEMPASTAARALLDLFD
jgi:LAO/AO transport system kinase